MTEQYAHASEVQPTIEHDASSLLDILSAVDVKRMTVCKVASELIIPAAQYKIDTIHYNYGPEGGIKADIDVLSGYISIVQAQLLAIEDKIEYIETEKKEPQQVYDETTQILEVVEERKLQIIQRMRELERESRTVERQKMLQDLKREKDIAGEDDRRLATDGKLHAAHEILRLNKALVHMTSAKDIRTNMLADYMSAVDTLRDEVDAAEAALIELINSIDTVSVIADKGVRRAYIPQPEQLRDQQDYRVSRPLSYGEYSQVREGVAFQPAHSVTRLPDEASSLPDMTATVSVEVPYVYELPPATEPERSLEDLLRQARAKSVKPAKNSKKSRPWKRMGV